MHKILSEPITVDSFDMDDFEGALDIGNGATTEDMVEEIIQHMENLRLLAVNTKDPVLKKKYWKELIRWTPSGWTQKRTITMSYENLLAMCSKGQRRFHKLNEWSGRDKDSVENFIAFARKLPYAQELIFIDELETEQEKLDKTLRQIGVALYKENGDIKRRDEIIKDISKVLNELCKES